VEANVRIISNGGCAVSPYHDVVSKHYDNSDVNYLLRPGYATINTAHGFYETKPIPILENECHHIAMVYDGSYLRFYLDDFVDSVIATGNLITNSFNTLIGYSAGFNPNWYTQYFGFIDEVRIWNVARTKEQIQNYALTTLPDPTNQVGLVAYYNFENAYQNMEGKNSFNGTPTGNCTIVTDSINCLIPERDIIIYPNPVHSPGTIRFSRTLKDAELNIYDVCGKRIRTIKEFNGDELKINRGILSCGLYFIVLIQGGNTFTTHKLIIIN
jgi:hypothetical protein